MTASGRERSARLCRFGWLPGSVLLFATFMIHDGSLAASAARLAAVLFIYPLIVVGGANVEPKGLAARWAYFSGELSYPLYILHDPFFSLVAAASLMIGLKQQPSSVPESMVRFAVIVALAWITFKIYDEPLRRRLSRWSTVTAVPT